MGTTSDKLTYLNTTKQKLKDSINALGGDITSETTFRNYATELDNIYSNLPKTTGKGSNLSLTTLKGRINVDDIKGDTQQDTYEGYNLFTTNGNVDGVTIGITKKSISESEILFNGTTSQAENIIYKNDVFTLPSGTYTMKVEVDTSKFTKPQGTDMAIYLRNTSGNATIYETTLNLLINNSGTYIKTFTLSADTNIRFQVYTNTAGIVFNNASFKFTLVSGSETKPYEQYVGGTASPNPSYPQEIEVVRGKNRLPVPYDYSSQTRDGITFTINDDGSIKANGTATGNATFVLQFQSQELRNLLLKNDCMLSGCPSGGSNSTYKLQLYGYTSSGVGSLADTGSGVSLASFENETNSFNIAILILTGTTVNNIIFKPMIEIGSQATSYLPYNTQEVVVQNKNLFDENIVTTKTLNGITAKFENGKLNVTGTATAGTNIFWNYNIDKSLLGKTLTLSYSDTFSNIYNIGFKNAGSNKVVLLANTPSKTFQVTQALIDEVNQFSMWIVSGSVVNASINIQLEYGSTATTYVPYQEQTQQLRLGDIELAKIGTYQDRIFETSGKQMLNVTATSQTKNNIVFTINNGIVNANGTGNSSTGLVLGQVQLEAGKTYYLSGCASGGGSGKYTLSINAENDTTRLVDDTGSGTSYTPSTSGTYDIRLNYWYNYNIQNLTFYPMVSTTQISFEPYGSDKWYIEKNIGKVVLNGSETGWGTQNDVFCIEINDILTQSYDERSIIVLSNYFLGAITAYRGGINNLTIAKTIDKGKPKQLGIRYDAFNNVVADFKTWLSTHNTNVYYVLATPTYEEITNETLKTELNELEKMMSYNGQTNISVSCNLPMLLSVSALKGESE